MVDGETCGPGECGDAPQGCLDWCDADAYCKAMGKRMCGKVGGGHLGYYDAFDDPSVSQWHNACSSGGANAYPYGDTFIDDACNDKDPLVEGAKAVASLTTCQSPDPAYAGVYDLSGNIAEWEDYCGVATDPNGPLDGSDDPCRVRGGFASQTGEDVACGADMMGERRSAGPGIRCCYP